MRRQSAERRAEWIEFSFGAVDPERAEAEEEEDGSLYGGKGQRRLANFLTRRTLCEIDEFCRPLKSWVPIQSH